MSNKNAAKRIPIVSIKMVRDSSILYKTRNIKSTIDAAELGYTLFQDLDREHVIVCCLDTKNIPTCINTVSIGTLDDSPIHPREIFKPAILSNAARIILYHNHPSGDTTPSDTDINITKQIKKASDIIGIDLLDHLIICENNKYTSLLEYCGL